MPFRRTSTVRCRQLVELVSDYLDGGLDPKVRAAVEAHLATCGDCRGYVAQVERLLDLTRGTLPTDVPDELVDTLTRRFRERR